MKIRPIDTSDLPDVARLLHEGFPSKTISYWEASLSVLAGRPQCNSLPQFGMTIDDDGTLQGVMLTIGSTQGDQIFCNLSSWYVRPDFRKYSALLMQRAVKAKGLTYTDCSPAEQVLPIVTKFGFSPYTSGALLIDARQAFRRDAAQVTDLTEGDLNTLDPEIRERISLHMSYGCEGLVLHRPDASALPLLFRTRRLKGLIPAAQFVYGNPDALINHAASISRKLVFHGVPMILIDLPSGASPRTGRILPSYNLRYAKGDNPPPAGYLLDTEIALFGF